MTYVVSNTQGAPSKAFSTKAEAKRFVSTKMGKVGAWYDDGEGNLFAFPTRNKTRQERGLEKPDYVVARIAE